MDTKAKPAINTRNGSASKAIFWGGLACGILDMASALVAYGSKVPLIRIPQSIASGLQGPDAFQGGVNTAILGTALHFVIAFGAATTYYLTSRKLAFLRESPILAGVFYGECVFLFMHFVVIPLSHARQAPLSTSWPFLLAGPLGHPFLVGLPIALAVWRFGR